MVGVAAVGQALSNQVNGRVSMQFGYSNSGNFKEPFVVLDDSRVSCLVMCFLVHKECISMYVYIYIFTIYMYKNMCVHNIYLYMYCIYIYIPKGYTAHPATPAIHPSHSFFSSHSFSFSKKTPSVHLRSSTTGSLLRPWTKVPIMNPRGPEEGSFPCPLEMRSDKFRRSCSICLNPRWTRRYTIRGGKMDGKWWDKSLIPFP